MDLRKIKKLIELLEDSALVEMEITEGDNSIRLSRASNNQAQGVPATGQIPVIHAVEQSPVASPVAASASVVSQQTAESPVSGKVIESPMVGTFYNSPSPDDAPYVTVGSAVSEGDPLCLIEAMKTFNQIEAEISGVITVIHKNSGDPVEYGEPLFVIE